MFCVGLRKIALITTMVSSRLVGNLVLGSYRDRQPSRQLLTVTICWESGLHAGEGAGRESGSIHAALLSGTETECRPRHWLGAGLGSRRSQCDLRRVT